MDKVPTRPVIIFLGDFTSRTSANSGAQSVTSSYRFRFGELGAALCAPELDIGQESMASLIDLVKFCDDLSCLSSDFLWTL
jgi:hypothetical protein